MSKKRTGMYTDDQWRWLNDKYVKGYSVKTLAAWAMCNQNNVYYHFMRLGLPMKRDALPALDLEEFRRLGDAV